MRSVRPLPAVLRGAQPLLLVLLCLGAFASHAVADGAPTITDFSPANGPVGTPVVIDGTNFTPPVSVTFAGNVLAEGSFTSTKFVVIVPDGAQNGPITVTTAGGSVSTATPFTVGGAVTPTAILTATIPSTREGSDQPGEFTVNLSSASANKVFVKYTISGSAVNGTDYVSLPETVKIKPGRTSATIKVVPLGDLGGGKQKKVKLTLEAGTGYTVADSVQATVKIKPAD